MWVVRARISTEVNMIWQLNIKDFQGQTFTIEVPPEVIYILSHCMYTALIIVASTLCW